MAARQLVNGRTGEKLLQFRKASRRDDPVTLKANETAGRLDLQCFCDRVLKRGEPLFVGVREVLVRASMEQGKRAF